MPKPDMPFPRQATIKRCADLLKFCDRKGSKDVKLDARDFRNLVEIALEKSAPVELFSQERRVLEARIEAVFGLLIAGVIASDEIEIAPEHMARVPSVRLYQSTDMATGSIKLTVTD